MAIDYQQILDETGAAILALTVGGAESYSIRGRQVTKLNMKELRETVDWCEQKIAQQGGSSGGSMSTLTRLDRHS